jgi:hypothetical protein
MNGAFEFGSPAIADGVRTQGCNDPRKIRKWRVTMKKFATASIFALTVAAAGAAFAQTTPAPSTTPSTPSAPPAVSSPTTPPATSTMPSTGSGTGASTGGAAVTMDAATEAKFKAADKANKGVIEGAALEPYKPVMSKVDMDKDGKISKAEFAVKAGIIK